MNKLKRIKQVRIHHEGNHTLVGSALFLIMCCAVAYAVGLPDFVFYALVALSIAVYAVILNFFRCPKRRFQGDTADVVVAPADGKVVVNEEVEENEYFGDRRMVSIFMSLVNVHANWFPVDGYVTRVEHQNGNFHMAWLPKASLENEHSTVIIRTPRGQEIMVRQVAGALARRIVTYARPDEECYIDEHLGFVKFGSRVDLFLPLDAKVEVSLGQSATGNQTVIARLKAD